MKKTGIRSRNWWEMAQKVLTNIKIGTKYQIKYQKIEKLVIYRHPLLPVYWYV